MKKSYEYLENAIALLKKIEETQSDAIEAAAQANAKTLEAGGLIYTFGTGHSHILAEEVFYRAGGFAPVYPILDDALMLHTNASRSSQFERIEGYAKTLLNALPINSKDIIYIFSNSGRNTMPIEAAMWAGERGITSVCITNLNHSRSCSSRHPSGKMLYEVSDIVIDNCGITGDAALDIDGMMVGPTSTVTGAAILHAIMCRTAEILGEKGIKAEIFPSGNIDTQKELGEYYVKKYSPVIRIL